VLLGEIFLLGVDERPDLVGLDDLAGEAPQLLVLIGVASRARVYEQWVATIALVYTLFGVLQVIIAVVLIFLVLLHSGKDAGLSGAFGIGGGGSSFGGGSMVERNLDRATVFFAVLFVLNTFLLLKIS
jgi:preprotein translocase subunit SecG